MDGFCDLLEAIEAANSDAAVNECPAGRGTDRILLTGGATYPVARTLRFTSPVVVETRTGTIGQAAIVAAPGFVTDPGDRWSSCLLYASGKMSDLKLADVALSQDPSLSLSGACATYGPFQIRRGRVSGFRQGGIAGYCLPELGCDHENVGDDNTTIAVLNSLVDRNSNPRSGGGIFSEGWGLTLLVEHSAIVDNSSDQSGGGLYYGGGWQTHRLENSTVSGNRAMSGAGMMVKFAPCTASYVYVLNSTIAFNTAVSSGGGIQFEGQVDCYAQDVNVMASIVSNNTAMTTMQSNTNDDWKGGQYNCDHASLMYIAPGFPRPSPGLGTPCRFDVPDALLAPLQPMGGAMNLPVHVPRRGSPAIDAGADVDVVPGQQRDVWIAVFDPPSPAPWTLFDRAVDGNGDGTAWSDLGAYEVNDIWEAELLAVQAKGPAAHEVVTTPDGYHRGAATHYAAAGANGQFVTYVLPVAEAGHYALSVGVRRTSDGGQFQVAVADDASGPWTDLGAGQESYAASSSLAEIEVTADRNFESAGQKLVRLTVTGKNTASAGYQLFVDYFKLTRLP